MEKNKDLEEFAKGLVEHYATGGTIEQAIYAGKKTKLPREIVEVFPGMVLDATRFAAGIMEGNLTLNGAIDAWMQHGANREDAQWLISLAIEEIQRLQNSINKKPWWKFW